MLVLMYSTHFMLIYVLLFDSWCSAHGFAPIPEKRIKPDLQNKHGPLTYHFS